MLETLARSWAITKLSFGVIRRDPELLAFPLFGGLMSALYTVAVCVPAFILVRRAQGSPLEDVTFRNAAYATTFAIYFGLSFVATFFNTCTVYTTKVRLEGGNATLGASLAYAFSRTAHIAAWSAIAATVGVLLRIVERASERGGGAGGLVLSIIDSTLGMLWSVVTIFVVPDMVYRGVGPLDAISGSTQAIKRTWGESLVSHIGLGVTQFAFLFVGIAAGGGLMFLLSGELVTVLVVAGVVGAYLLAVVLAFSAATAVFNTALYVYAGTGRPAGDFNAEQLSSALRHR